MICRDPFLMKNIFRNGKITAVPNKNMILYTTRNTAKMDLFFSPIDFERATNSVSFFSFMNAYIKVGSIGNGLIASTTIIDEVIRPSFDLVSGV